MTDKVDSAYAALVRAVRERHVEAMTCGATTHRGLACGFDSANPIHDVYPIIEKRDKLPEGFIEAQRHTYQPTLGRGMCLADMDDWPCIEARLVREIPR